MRSRSAAQLSTTNFSGPKVLFDEPCDLLTRIAANCHQKADHNVFFPLDWADIPEVYQYVLDPLIALIFAIEKDVSDSLGLQERPPADRSLYSF